MKTIRFGFWLRLLIEVALKIDKITLSYKMRGCILCSYVVIGLFVSRDYESESNPVYLLAWIDL